MTDGDTKPRVTGIYRPFKLHRKGTVRRSSNGRLFVSIAVPKKMEREFLACLGLDKLEERDIKIIKFDDGDMTIELLDQSGKVHGGEDVS